METHGHGLTWSWFLQKWQQVSALTTHYVTDIYQIYHRNQSRRTAQGGAEMISELLTSVTMFIRLLDRFGSPSCQTQVKIPLLLSI